MMLNYYRDWDQNMYLLKFTVCIIVSIFQRKAPTKSTEPLALNSKGKQTILLHDSLLYL